MGQTRIGLTPTETRRFDVGRPKDWQPSIRSQEEVDDLWLDRMLNKAKRTANASLDFLTGSTPQEEASIALDPANMTPLMLSMGSLLRNPVYRAKMLSLFKEQMGRLDRRYVPALERLTETHPRLVAAFQDAGGTLDVSGPGLGPRGTAEGLYRNTLESRATGTPAKAWANPHFTSFKGTPEIQFKGTPFLTHHPATVVPHEFTHFAQDLGGRGVLRQRIDTDAHKLADAAEGITDRWKQFRAGGGRHGIGGVPDQGTFRISPEEYRRINEFTEEGRRIRAQTGDHELGAERAAIRQRERFERWQRGEPDWAQYKGPGHGQEARHLTLDEVEPGKLTGQSAVTRRWPDEMRRLMEARRDRESRRLKEVRRKKLAETAPKSPEGLRRFWPF